jgi:hypothetical protein
MYGLPETTDDIYDSFGRVGHGTATDEDYQLLKNHIDNKKRSIREAKIALGIDGFKSATAGYEKTPIQKIMRELDGGRI